MVRKLRAAQFHEDVFVKGLGNVGRDIDVVTETTRYKKIAMSTNSVGILLDLTTNTGSRLEGFAPWTMVKYATMLPEDSPPPSSAKAVRAA